MNIRFAELPKTRTTRGAWGEESAALKSNQTQWAHFEEFDEGTSSRRTQFVNHVNRGDLKAFQPKGAFQARVIKGQVWVRFVGEAE